MIVDLLNRTGLEYVTIGPKYRGLVAKAFGQSVYLARYLRLIRENDIHCVLGMSPAVAMAAKVTRKKMFFFDDDDSSVQPVSKRFTVPLSDHVITPRCLAFEKYGRKHHTYAGYQELAYLAPAVFTPDICVIRRYCLEPGNYFVVRWNEFKAHHDVGRGGIPKALKRRLIRLLEPEGRILITSEYELDSEYSQYRISINPLDIHHVLAYARMLVGDSQTMSAEAAVLGTPAIRCNSFKGRIAYLNELERVYHLTYSFSPYEGEAMLEQVRILLREEGLREIWQQRREAMLSEMEDVNQFIYDLVMRV